MRIRKNHNLKRCREKEMFFVFSLLAAEDWGEYIVQVREEGGREMKV